MSKAKSDPPNEKISLEDLEGPLVADVQKSLGELFHSTINAMRLDVVQTIETNKADSHLEKAIRAFTDSMLVMIAERVEATIPKGAPPRTPPADEAAAAKHRPASARSGK